MESEDLKEKYKELMETFQYEGYDFEIIKESIISVCQKIGVSLTFHPNGAIDIKEVEK